MDTAVLGSGRLVMTSLVAGSGRLVMTSLEAGNGRLVMTSLEAGSGRLVMTSLEAGAAETVWRQGPAKGLLVGWLIDTSCQALNPSEISSYQQPKSRLLKVGRL